MATQQVNAAKLKKAGNELTDLSTKIKAETTKLDESIQKVSAIWSSEAGDTYLRVYKADKANLDELSQVMQQMGAALEQYSTNYQQADSKAIEVIGKHLAKG